MPLSASQARRARGQHIVRPKVLDEKKAVLAPRMRATGKSASTVANALGVSRASVYRVPAEKYRVALLAPCVLKLFRSFPLRSMLDA
jgi:DNA invertase Pin-like site-specific DNA recombinase